MSPGRGYPARKNNKTRDFNSFLIHSRGCQRRRRRANENETKKFSRRRTNMIGSTKQTARANSCERTNASAHAGSLLFVSSCFVPVFAHTRGVGGAGRTVAVRMLRTSPSVTRIIVSKIPTLPGQNGAPASWAHHPFTCHHALRPLGALPLVRTPVASLCCGSARMVASALVLTAVAFAVGYEPRASGVGAASHMVHTPLPD